MKKHILIFAACFFAWHAGAQTLLNQSFDTNAIDHLLISNLSGSIDIKSTSGNQIIIKTKKGDQFNDSETKIDYTIVNNALFIYFRSPCTKDAESLTFDPDYPFKSISSKNNCNWREDNDEPLPTIEFTVLVPKGIHTYASTVLGGDITIDGIKQRVSAMNVNGNVNLSNVEQVVEATTVNGDIVVDYVTNPKTNGRFKTINGDIELNMPPSPDFEAKFKCFNGELYTDIKKVEVQSNETSMKTQKKGHLVKINEYTKVKVGNGGSELDLETFNGNGYLTAK